MSVVLMIGATVVSRSMWPHFYQSQPTTKSSFFQEARRLVVRHSISATPSDGFRLLLSRLSCQACFYSWLSIVQDVLLPSYGHLSQNSSSSPLDTLQQPQSRRQLLSFFLTIHENHLQPHELHKPLDGVLIPFLDRILNTIDLYQSSHLPFLRARLNLHVLSRKCIRGSWVAVHVEMSILEVERRAG